MLKIKDNVDLKQLEKFGFTNIMGEYTWANKTTLIYIDDMNVLAYQNDPNSDGWYEFPSVLFDLISAGLVEKVVEE